MVTVRDIFCKLEEFAPVEWKMDFDNVGILAGRPESEVRRVLVSLDITEQVVREAWEKGCQLVVSHHPLFFSLKNVCSDDVVAKPVLSLCEKGIAAICMHTNLDVAPGGVNDALAVALGLTGVSCLSEMGIDSAENPYGLGRTGCVEECDLEDFLPKVKKALGANGLRYAVGTGRVRRVAVCGGSGGSELTAVRTAGCDTFVTADVKYNCFLDGSAMGINIIDAGHFPTENVVVEVLEKFISESFLEVSVEKSKCHCQIEKFYV